MNYFFYQSDQPLLPFFLIHQDRYQDSAWNQNTEGSICHGNPCQWLLSHRDLLNWTVHQELSSLSTSFLPFLFLREQNKFVIKIPINNTGQEYCSWLPFFFSPYGYLGQPVLLSLLLIQFLYQICNIVSNVMLGANRVTVVVVILQMDVKQVKIKFKLKFFNLPVSCFSIFFFS